MRETASKMHMHGMVTIDTMVFEIVGGWALKLPPGSSDGKKVSYFLLLNQ